MRQEVLQEMLTTERQAIPVIGKNHELVRCPHHRSARNAGSGGIEARWMGEYRPRRGWPVAAASIIIRRWLPCSPWEPEKANGQSSSKLPIAVLRRHRPNGFTQPC